ncbi:MAG TPA: thiamine phosphate synthase [Alphaproteobacteria bacterium]|nr:thiamine phosphate synthase [Alphaproteobacteria bacterium]
MSPADRRTILAKLAHRLNLRGPRRDLPALVLMSDEKRPGDVLASAAALPRGAAVILRHYGAPERAVLARKLAALCRRRHLKLLIAGDARLALRLGASGVHLPEHLAHKGRRFRLKRSWIVTAAAHGLPGLIRAQRAGADAALLGPVFPSESHPVRKPLGPSRFAALARRAPLPVYALGGIGAHNASRLKASGAIGIAAIGALQANRNDVST